MIRKIIQINEEKCNGCGACAAACHEGAIQMINGKAKLIRDDYCDGLGDCLPACPTGAITFEEREAAAYDPEAVQLHLKTRKDSSSQAQPTFSGCPGQAPTIHQPYTFRLQRRQNAPGISCPAKPALPVAGADPAGPGKRAVFPGRPSSDRSRLHRLRLCQFSPAFYPEPYHFDRMSEAGSRWTILKKLTEINPGGNDIKKPDPSSAWRFPCCGGIQHAATQALKASGKFIPWQVVTVKSMELFWNQTDNI